MATGKKGKMLYPDHDVADLIRSYQEQLIEKGERRATMTSAVLNSLIREGVPAIELQTWIQRNYPALYKQFLQRASKRAPTKKIPN
jgi:hypothetical protein